MRGIPASFAAPPGRFRHAALQGQLLAEIEIETDDVPGRVSLTTPGFAPCVRRNVATPPVKVARRGILTRLEHFGGDNKQTAEVLGASMKTLYNRLTPQSRNE